MPRLLPLTAILFLCCEDPDTIVDAGFQPISSPGTQPVSSKAVYGQQCASDAECAGTGAPCLPISGGKACVNSCSSDADCAQGTRCVGSAQRCYPTCVNNASCSEGIWCVTDARANASVCGAIPSSSGARPDAGQPVDGGQSSPSENLAEKVWKAQKAAPDLSETLRESYGKSAISWVIAAAQAAGEQVTSGTLVENSDGSYRYAAGGSTLKIQAADGWTGELLVDELRGDVQAPGFPNGGDRIDVSWLWRSGKSARCVLEENSTIVSGVFLDDDKNEVTVEIEGSVSHSSFQTQQNGTLTTHASGIKKRSGMAIYDDRRIDFSMQSIYSMCLGSDCAYVANIDLPMDHMVKVTMGGQIWNLNYRTGYRKETQVSSDAEYWQGTITGPTNGSMEKRLLSAHGRTSLDVVIGADRYQTKTVTTP